MTGHEASNAAQIVFASVALAVLAASGGSDVGVVWGMTLWVLTYVWTSIRVLVRNGKLLPNVRIGTYTGSRILLSAGILALMSQSPKEFSILAWASACSLVALAAMEGVLRRAHSHTGVRAANIPGVRVRTPNAVLANTFLISSLLSPIVLAVFAGQALFGKGGAVPGIIWLIIVSQTVGLGIAIIADAHSRRRLSHLAYEQLPRALERLAPKFVFYWDAPRGTSYQLGMWLPYLKRIGEPFYILVRNPNTFAQALSVSYGAPTVLARTMAEMDRLLPQSLTTAFYANNGAKNAHFVRYSHLTHIQLLHGDSDKASSYNPITAMFDRIYVAGQAGIDRYFNHNVHIPLEKFRIVGRPQVEGIMRSSEIIGEKSNPVVLYAPTWRGAYSDADYSSLPLAPHLFDELLRRNCSIIFRPHPYCDRDPEFREIITVLHAKLAHHQRTTGVQHVYGEQAEVSMSVIDCFNASDAMISDVSSVVVDFLYSEKPFALVSMGMSRGEFIKEFPLAEAAYVIGEDPADWDQHLDRLLLSDPLMETRREKRVHYLGDFKACSYAEAFITEARREVLSGIQRVNDDEDSDPRVVDATFPVTGDAHARVP